MKLLLRLAATFTLAWPVALGAAEERRQEPCSIKGEVIQWAADYCMAMLETDDEIAASDCIDTELQRPFRNSCAAKQHFKGALCALAIRRGVQSGPRQKCMNDPGFQGRTVQNEGVGN